MLDYYNGRSALCAFLPVILNFDEVNYKMILIVTPALVNTVAAKIVFHVT